MRTIRFRVWSKREKRMLHNVEQCEEYCKGCFGHYLSDCGDCYEIMQFTGLKDKSGKEIYEGDIFKVEGFERPRIIKWNEKLARFDLYNVWGDRLIDLSAEIEHYEIIGNIYQNPELLETEKV